MCGEWGCRVGWFVVGERKTGYEMRISDWSSDVCSSDLLLSLGFDLVFIKTLTQRMTTALGVANRIAHGELGSEIRADEKSENDIGRASCRERVCQYV